MSNSCSACEQENSSLRGDIAAEKAMSRLLVRDRDEWRALARELGAALELEQRAHAHRRLCGHCDKESLDNGAAGCHRWYALMDGYSSGESLAKLREKEEQE